MSNEEKFVRFSLQKRLGPLEGCSREIGILIMKQNKDGKDVTEPTDSLRRKVNAVSPRSQHVAVVELTFPHAAALLEELDRLSAELAAANTRNDEAEKLLSICERFLSLNHQDDEQVIFAVVEQIGKIHNLRGDDG